MNVLVFEDGFNWEEILVTLGYGRMCLAWL